MGDEGSLADLLGSLLAQEEARGTWIAQVPEGDSHEAEEEKPPACEVCEAKDLGRSKCGRALCDRCLRSTHGKGCKKCRKGFYKCGGCKRKLVLTSQQCRCGIFFCAAHMDATYSESDDTGHTCDFDFRALHIEQARRAAERRFSMPSTDREGGSAY